MKYLLPLARRRLPTPSRAAKARSPLRGQPVLLLRPFAWVFHAFTWIDYIDCQVASRSPRPRRGVRQGKCSPVMTQSASGADVREERERERERVSECVCVCMCDRLPSDAYVVCEPSTARFSGTTILQTASSALCRPVAPPYARCNTMTPQAWPRLRRHWLLTCCRLSSVRQSPLCAEYGPVSLSGWWRCRESQPPFSPARTPPGCLARNPSSTWLLVRATASLSSPRKLPSFLSLLSRAVRRLPVLPHACPCSQARLLA